MPFLSCKFFASQKTYGTIAAGLLPAAFAFSKPLRGFDFAEFALRANSWKARGGVWGEAPNSENQNAPRFGSPRAFQSRAFFSTALTSGGTAPARTVFFFLKVVYF
jgi:hypothetical protein